MKPGWKTTEFWQTAITQGLSLLTLVGFVSGVEAKTLEDALAKCVAAIFALAANGLVVVLYVKGRLSLKVMEGQEKATRAKTTIAPVFVAVGLLLATAPVYAQSILPWRNGIQQKVNQHEAQIAQLLGQQRQQPMQQTPAPQPIIIMHPAAPAVPQTPPLQTFPIQGQPQQSFPIQGPPRQELPIQGQPQQQLPIQGMPQQQLPIQGSPQPLPTAPPTPPASPQAYSIRHALQK
jgi:hypothetical protein